VLLESLGPQIEAKEAELGEVRREWDALREATAESNRVRAGMLEGGSVAQAQEDATRRAKEIAAEVEIRQKEADALAAEIQRLEGAARRNATERAGLGARVVQDAPAVAGLADADWGACIVEGLPDPVRVAALADAAARVCEARAMECRNDLVRIRTELSIDDRAREQVGDLATRLEAQAAVAARWGNLSAAIGSADGKAFRTIAQQYTLEALLAEANRELSIITPRYSLRMLGESMHFGVVDHDSFGELRPVHTLSGGESFIVSLSLALGLSRMAGGDLAVESLFIDEGFGTLDSDTLRCVMAALSSLHSQGRKVGLITHVEEMKEQIPVRIEVVKMGQGASRVEVRG
jgi:exonuclease SbcC